MHKKKHHALVRENEPYYSYWQALYLSLFSMRLYIDVLKRWKGLGWKYLALLLLLFSIPLTLRILIQFNHFVMEQVILPFKLVPRIDIQNGKVIYNKPMPHLIKNTSGKVVAIIDTTGKMTTIESNLYPNLALLITEDSIQYREPPFQIFLLQKSELKSNPVVTQKLPKETNEVFDGKRFIQSISVNKLKWLVACMTYPTVFIIFFMSYAGFFLVFGVLAQFIAKLLLRSPLTFLQTCRLLAVSSTASIMMLMLALAFDIQFAGMGMILLVMMSIYFSLAGIVYRREMSQLVRGKR